MITTPRTFRKTVPFVAVILLFAVAASADEVRVMTSGAFTAAYLELVPQFEQTTHHSIVSAFGASMGDSPDSIPSRLRRGEPVDVVIVVASALDDLIKAGKVVAGSRVDLVRSSIGMAVKAGAPKPDISSVDALERTLRAAKSIAYSDSASGVYLSTVLFPRLGIADEMKSKSRKVQGNERVGAVVARGEAEIGFQQISELLPVPGITYVGPLPAGAQHVTIVSAGIAVGARAPQAAAALVHSSRRLRPRGSSRRAASSRFQNPRVGARSEWLDLQIAEPTDAARTPSSTDAFDTAGASSLRT